MDVWSNVGGSVASKAEGWLYQQNNEVRGPVSRSALAERLIRGQISPTTPVARQGGDFHPLSQVAAFAKDLQLYAVARRDAASRRNRNIVLLSLVLVVAAGAGLFYILKEEAKERQASRKVAAKALAAAREVERGRMEELLNKEVELVAVVSFDEKNIEVGRRPTRRKGRGFRSRNEPTSEQMVSQCTRTPQAIVGAVRRHLSKLDVCVEDEKSRGQGDLPARLILDFVVTAEGKVKDFAPRDRHYRTGPMRNCLLKVFRQVRFPAAKGTSCPVAIPMKTRS